MAVHGQGLGYAKTVTILRAPGFASVDKDIRKS